MLICFPGRASRVKRAATSAIRPAPLVITTNCTTVMMTKITRPTTKLFPTTILPKASITFPASALVRIRRVEEIFSARRKRVAVSSREGKMLRCRVSLIKRVVSRMIREKVIFRVSRMSRTSLGTGTIMMATTITKATAARISMLRLNAPRKSRFTPVRCGATGHPPLPI